MTGEHSKQAIRGFWEQGAPMSFTSENVGYEEKRKFRYSLQDYMHLIVKGNK